MERVARPAARDVRAGARSGDSATTPTALRGGFGHQTVTALDVLAAALEAIPGRRDAHRWVELLADLTHELGRHVTLPQS